MDLRAGPPWRMFQSSGLKLLDTHIKRKPPAPRFRRTGQSWGMEHKCLLPVRKHKRSHRGEFLPDETGTA